MILYDFGCTDGHVFEAWARSGDDDATCPCGASARRRPPRRVHTTGASAGVSRDRMPRSWRGVNGGDPETVRHWQGVAERRERLEERHPELAGDRRPVLAHEGIFAARPLRLGDDIGASIAAATKAAAAPAATTAERTEG